MLKIIATTLLATSCVVFEASSNHGAIAQHMDMQQPGMSTMAMPAKTFKIGKLTIETPWLRATPRGAPVAGGYMKITNNGTEPDRLVGGSLDRAGGFEIHEMSMSNGVMQMRMLPKGLELKPGASVELAPGGYHIMGTGLKGGYSQGETIKGTLTFEKAGTVNIEYTVAPIGAPGPHGAH